MWRPVSEGPSVSIDVLVALGDDIDSAFTSPAGRPLDGSIDVVSSTATVTARVPIGAGVSVVADFPFSYARFANPDVPALGLEAGAEDDVTFGNPYVGAEALVGVGLTLGGGVRLPLNQYERDGFADPEQFGWQGGFTADRERFEAYLPEVLTVSALARYEPLVGPVRLRLLLAPAYLVDVFNGDPYGDPDFGRTGFALGYGVQAEVAEGPVALWWGVVGRPILTGERFDLFSTDAAVTAGAAVPLGPVRASVTVRVPIVHDRFVFDSDATVGLGLDVPLR